MHVIRHDHIATNRSAEIALGSFGEENECGMNFFASQTRSSAMGTKGDEIEWARMKDSAKT
jgi:hypothetical protein